MSDAATPETAPGPARCTVCSHPRRASIEHSPALGWTVRETCDKFGVSRSSFYRHRAHSDPVVSAPARQVGLLRGLAGVWPAEGEAAGHFAAIFGALLEAGSFSTFADLTRTAGVAEADLWAAVEASAEGRGLDAGEVFDRIYAPMMGSGG